MGQAPGGTVQRRKSSLAIARTMEEETEEILPQGKYSMMQYAREAFRQGQELFTPVEGTVRGTMSKIGLMIHRDSH